ncbi:MAG: DUF3667 domain-containing protein [Phenylobacterium sp.]
MARATKLRVVGGTTQVYVTPRPLRHGLEVGAPCPNCGTALAGAYCYTCGQKGEEFHRSIWLLTADAFHDVLNFDGRFWRTLPLLVARPGKLTRDYLDGHRASQIPPFRLFLIVLVVVFFAGSLNLQKYPVNYNVRPENTFIARDPGDRADFKQAFDAMQAKPETRWLADRLQIAWKNPDALMRSMGSWAHQFAILLLPIAALMLSLLFLFKRGVYVFDHLIFSMHSLSFQGLLLTGVFLGGLAVPWASWALMFAPVHLFVHMRETYGISAIGTLIRMFLLFTLSSVAFALLMAGLVFVGLATVH